MIPRTLADREEELVGTELVVTKLDAARTQLHTAIDLFFGDGDHVSQFTLVSAAHGILRDVASARGIKKSFKDSPLIAVARDEHHPGWRERHSEPAPLPEGSPRGCGWRFIRIRRRRQ